MAVVKINTFVVPEGRASEVEQRFAAHQKSLDGTPGFLGFELLRPTGEEEKRYFVYTRWESDEAFQAWQDEGDDSDAAHAAQSQSSRISTGAGLLEFEVVTSSDGQG